MITLTLPSGHTETLTTEQWASLRGAANRQVKGSGKPLGWRAERCPCGAWTLTTAKRKQHVCGQNGAK